MPRGWGETIIVGRKGEDAQINPLTQRKLETEGFKDLPPAFDPTEFRRRVEAERGGLAAPGLRSLGQLARRGQIAGRFGSPAVQAFEQGRTLEGYGAGRGQILAGAGQAAIGREAMISRLQQQERERYQERLRELQEDQEQERSLPSRRGYDYRKTPYYSGAFQPIGRRPTQVPQRKPYSIYTKEGRVEPFREPVKKGGLSRKARKLLEGWGS